MMTMQDPGFTMTMQNPGSMMPMQGLGPWDPFGRVRWEPWDPFGRARRPWRPKADMMEAEGRPNGGLGAKPPGI